jgi:uncharacterized protein YndB with AHSA1/START domain
MPDPKLDLVFERVVDVPRSTVWKAWTKPEHIVKWFAPRPWSTVECQVDLRPGGIFRTVNLEMVGNGTRYTATALHRDEATRQRHADMGFHEGWGTALDQLEGIMRER